MQISFQLLNCGSFGLKFKSSKLEGLCATYQTPGLFHISFVKEKLGGMINFRSKMSCFFGGIIEFASFLIKVQMSFQLWKKTAVFSGGFFIRLKQRTRCCDA